MTCDKRSAFSTSTNTFQFPVNTGRTRLFSSPDKQDLETIYEVRLIRWKTKTRVNSVFFLSLFN